MAEVRLRRWRADDLDAIAVMARDEHVSRWSDLPDDPAAWLEAEITETRGPTRAICDLGRDLAVGRVAVRLPAHASAATRCEAVGPADAPVGELSYWLVPAARGHGRAQAAIEQMMDIVGAETELRSVVLDIEVTNAASLRLARRVGAQRRSPTRIEHDRQGTARELAVHVLRVRSPAIADSPPVA